MKDSKLDERFDSGEDVLEDFDVSKARRPLLKQRRVNVDFPIWMIESLDKESERLGVTRQSVVKMWIGERLEQLDCS